MYCSGCGQLLDINEPVCRRCGRPVAAVPAPPQAAAPFARFPWVRVQRHLQTLGILWIVYAAYSVLQALLAATVLAGVFGGFGHRWGTEGFPWPQFPFYHLPWLLPVITTITVARAILSAATGLALLRRAPWGRTLALVTAFLTLIKPLTGTILAIYTLWALLPASSGEEYDRITVP